MGLFLIKLKIFERKIFPLSNLDLLGSDLRDLFTLFLFYNYSLLLYTLLAENIIPLADFNVWLCCNPHTLSRKQHG